MEEVLTAAKRSSSDIAETSGPIVRTETKQIQQNWASVPIASRLQVVRAFRNLIVDHAEELVAPAGGKPVEALASQVLPLADACRFLEKKAEALLRPSRVSGRGRSRWLGRIALEERRDPLGLVLIVAACNYPLFLPAVQLLQALIAGNAVAVKPGRGGTDAMVAVARFLKLAGLPDGLLRVLGEENLEVSAVLERGIDKLFFTGSRASGQRVMETASRTLTPCVMELSGADALFVLVGADLDRVTDAIVFGLNWNGSDTCIAPRRVFVQRQLLPELLKRIAAHQGIHQPRTLSSSQERILCELSKDEGLRCISGKMESQMATPHVFVADDACLLDDRFAVFAPCVALQAFDDCSEALSQDALCAFSLGASVFGPEEEATHFARRIDAGIVTVNDVIVPTADARVSFGGRRSSGFGATRGAHGLVEMTQLKTIAVRRGGWLPHLTGSVSASALHALLQLVHSSSVSRKLKAALSLMRNH